MRLKSFQYLYTICTFPQVNNDAASVQQNLIGVVENRAEFLQLCQQIDNLERFVDAAEHSVEAMEKSVDQADSDMGVNSLGLKGLLLRGKKWATEAATGGVTLESASTSIVESKIFIAPEVFRTGDYFTGNESPECCE